MLSESLRARPTNFKFLNTTGIRGNICSTVRATVCGCQIGSIIGGADLSSVDAHLALLAMDTLSFIIFFSRALGLPLVGVIVVSLFAHVHNN